jgi:hypothetical protein
MNPEVGTGQLQPVIASMVAGTHWGQQFIAEQVLPAVDTWGKRFAYETYDNAGLVDHGATKRAMRSESKVLQPAASSSVTKELEDYSAKIPTDVEEIHAARVQDMIRPRPADGMNSVDRLRLSRARIIHYNNQIQKEKAAASLVFGASNYVLTDTSAPLNFKTCTIKDLKNARREAAKRCGFDPDIFALGWTSRMQLDENANILDRISGAASKSDPAVVSDELLASLIGVKKLAVGTAVTQTKALPGQTGTPTDLWTPDKAAFIYSGDFAGADLASPAFGKLGYMNYPETGVRYKVKTWMNDEGNIEWTLAAEEFLVFSVMTAAGYLFTNTDV